MLALALALALSLCSQALACHFTQPERQLWFQKTPEPGFKRLNV